MCSTEDGMAQQSDLADFIHEKRDAIVAEWQAFAQTLLPAAGGMNDLALRDHADEILTAITHDIRSRQSSEEQAEKSKGRGQAQRLGEIGQVHAALRIENGFKLGQLVSEYRALRASVLRLWQDQGNDPRGVTRFNEAIDEALVEAVNEFTKTTEHYRDQTLSILSHDLRNPLGAIITGSTMLVGSEQLDDRTVRIAARMLSSANRMNRMIAALLDLTRTRAGDRIPVNPEALDLEPLCRQVVAELEGLQPAGGLQLSAKGDLCGVWDGDRIAQVISNLIRNAIQHGQSSKPIEVELADAGEEVTLKVHNWGEVLSPSVQSTMFEPMVRHVGNDRKNKGFGLGLYIALQVVLAHHGTLTVTSTEAEGTTFTAKLPRTPPPTSA
jgi:signal transduction histidine kinase